MMKLFAFFAVLIVATLALGDQWALAADNCRPELLETIPDGMRSATFETRLRETHKVLTQMANEAKKSIKIAAMYVTLTDPERADHPSAEPGKEMLQSLLAATKRGVKLEIVLDNTRDMSNLDDVKKLEEVGTIYRLNMTRLYNAGIMHTKFMITDDETLYVGSTNFDWRSMSQVKEMGVHFQGCSTMASDLEKVFQTYKLMSQAHAGVPERLPESMRTSINMYSPFQLDGKYSMYFAGSPPTMFQETFSGRSDDLEALLSVINSAQRYIKVSVMNFNIRSAYGWPKHYWPVLENALKRAVIERRVRVQLLFSDWRNTREEEYIWYKSLNAIQQREPRDPNEKYAPPLGYRGGIFVKLFKVPAYDEFQRNIPFARVKHDKYVVTENSVYVGTSNWTPEYFENTCGVGFVYKSKEPLATGPSIIDDLNKVFNRDFYSAEFSRKI